MAEGSLAAAEWEAEEIRGQDAGFSTRTWLDTYPLTITRLRNRLLALVAKVGL